MPDQGARHRVEEPREQAGPPEHPDVGQALDDLGLNGDAGRQERLRQDDRFTGEPVDRTGSPDHAFSTRSRLGVPEEYRPARIANSPPSGLMTPMRPSCWRIITASVSGVTSSAETVRFWRYGEFSAGEHPVSGEELRAALRQSTADRLAADVEIGAYLGGGFHSTAIVMESAALVDGPVRTFSVVSDDVALDEGRISLKTGGGRQQARVDPVPAQRHHDPGSRRWCGTAATRSGRRTTSRP
jgi:hypothetical protein